LPISTVYHSLFDLFKIFKPHAVIFKPHAVHNLTAKALPYGTILNKNMRFHLIGTGISRIGPGTFRKFSVVPTVTGFLSQGLSEDFGGGTVPVPGTLFAMERNS
jgi:hypothetical protein